MRKLVLILKLTNLFVGFDKSVLAYVKRVFSITGQAQAVAENLLFPAAYQEIEGFSIPAHHPLRQVFVSQRDKRQWVSLLAKM